MLITNAEKSNKQAGHRPRELLAIAKELGRLVGRSLAERDLNIDRGSEGSRGIANSADASESKGNAVDSEEAGRTGVNTRDANTA